MALILHKRPVFKFIFISRNCFESECEKCESHPAKYQRSVALIEIHFSGIKPSQTITKNTKIT